MLLIPSPINASIIETISETVRNKLTSTIITDGVSTLFNGTLSNLNPVNNKGAANKEYVGSYTSVASGPLNSI